MAGVTCKERVATLEHLVAHVLQTTAQGEHPQDWGRTDGMFDGDPMRQEIIAEGRRRPEKDRLQTRPCSCSLLRISRS
jgi:hypothetical protein